LTSGLQIAARSNVARHVASLARGIARIVATHAVHARSTQAAIATCTGLAIFIVAISIDIARHRGARARPVILALWHIRARSNATRNVARAARRCARIVATNAVDAIRAHAFRASTTRLAQRFLAHGIAVARIIGANAAW
jgi:hypothetical protein